MRKIIVLVIMLTLSMGLAGCGKKTQEQAKQIMPTSEKTGLRVMENNTLMGWLMRGKGVVCKITSPEGEIVISAKDNKVRIDGIPYAAPNATEESAAGGVSLTVGDMMYMWGGKQGMKFDVKKMKELAGEETGNTESWEEMVEGWEKAKMGYNCGEAGLADNLFIPPGDVNFADFTVFMESMADFGKKLEKSQDGGEALNMDDIEKKLKELEKQMQ